MTEENEDKAAWVLEIMYLAEELCVFNYYSWVSHSLARKQGPQRECGAVSAVMGRARETQLPGGAGRNAPAAEEVKARQSMSSPEYFFICRRAEVMRLLGTSVHFRGSSAVPPPPLLRPACPSSFASRSPAESPVAPAIGSDARVRGCGCCRCA